MCVTDFLACDRDAASSKNVRGGKVTNCCVNMRAVVPYFQVVSRGVNRISLR